MIEDTGIGMRTEQLPLVFDRFYRADSAREHYRGTGLGLSICKSIVEAHGGTIEVSSTLKQGSCFTVCLPLLRQEDDDRESVVRDHVPNCVPKEVESM